MAGTSPVGMLATAKGHHKSGRLAEAERLYRLVCSAERKNAEAHHLLAIVAHQLQRSDAIALIDRAAALTPKSAQIQNDRGVILAAHGQRLDSIDAFGRAINLKPDYLDARNNLGSALREAGRLEEAVPHFQYILVKVPDSPVALVNLATTFRQLGRPEEAIPLYEKALARQPDFIDAHAALAMLFQVTGQHQDALAHANRAVALAPGSAGLRNNLGNVLRTMERLEDALGQYDSAIAIDPKFAMAYYNRGIALRGLSRIADAKASFVRARDLQPDFFEAQLAACMAELPILYRDGGEIAERRGAYAQALNDLREGLNRERSTAPLAEVLGSHQPFYLPYQGFNDRALQATYGELAARVMEDRYGKAVSLPSSQTGPVKIGIVSGFFRRHSNWKIPIKGWVEQLDPDRFHITAYYTGAESDPETETAKRLCRNFIQGPLPLDAWRNVILNDAPDVLIFPEIGMDKVSTQLAAQRLARVQCCSWGHPVTSGFPTIDYFLSSDLMEPADAQQHYTERLVRLPNLSIYYEPVISEPIEVTRGQLGLREDAVVFWCCQSLPKYLPQFDDVFPRIAEQIGNCQFTFIGFPGGETITQQFKSRLDLAFANRGLNADDHCVILPRLSPDEFAGAMGLSDIMLDSIGWSGCNSTLESLAHNLPIVTFGGEFMRGRHTQAILEMMDITETITRNIDDYVSLACSLGSDHTLRKNLSAKIAGNKHRAYRDRTCITALEAFLENAVAGNPRVSTN
jgi:predicted O-linked N-acetylglucosamine transferase (SPINDLY family)